MKLDDKYLGQVCQPVARGEDVEHIIKGMLKLCFNENGEKIGVGLAANQAGINKRIIVLNHMTIADGMINPVIEKYRGGVYESLEGCLSYPEKFVKVKRHKIIKVSWFDENWEARSITMRGLMAACVQHEVDHLNGISMFERARLGLVVNMGKAE